MVVIVNRSRTTEMISESIVSFEILLTSVLKWEYHLIYEGCMGLYTRDTGRSHIHRHMHVLCVDAQTFHPPKENKHEYKNFKHSTAKSGLVAGSCVFII